MAGLPIHGRGAAENPVGRYERLDFEADPEYVDPDDPEPRPATHFYRDTTRKIIASNDSPDVGFNFSVNPYRGCEHGCAYCLSGETRIVLADGRQRPISDLRVGDEIYGTVRDGWYRRYVRTVVLAHWSAMKPAFRVTLEDGTSIVGSGDHRFLTERGWKHVIGAVRGPGVRPHLTVNNKLMGVGSIAATPTEISGQAVKSDAALRVASIEPLGIELPMYDITTGTGDFIANGVVSHNCYARPTHEWLGLSAGLDFETKIFVKEDAPALLRRELLSPKWMPATIAMSGVTDPYQPVERRLELTRGCLQVLAEFRNPVGIITKNHLLTRDVDIFAGMAEWGGAMVNLSITTLDPELQRVLEPRAATPQRRLDAVATLAAAGVPVGVMVAPVIPGLTDHELPAILKAVAEAGARNAGFVPLRLPHGVGSLFDEWLQRHYPDRRDKVLNRVREMRGGKLNDPNFGSRMRGAGEYIDQLRALFHVTCRKVGLNLERPALSTTSFRRPPGSAPSRRTNSSQTELF
jgi:DNA repair photolyase